MRHSLPVVLLVLTILSLLVGCHSGSRPTHIGQAAPDFTVQDAGKTISLHDFRGKVVLLNFWATWCPPCVQEMPSLVQLQKQLQGKVTVLAISVDVDSAAYHSFLRNHNVDLLTARDGDQKVNTLYGTYQFPETYVIDEKGVVRRKFVGAVEWNLPEITQYLSGL